MPRVVFPNPPLPWGCGGKIIFAQHHYHFLEGPGNEILEPHLSSSAQILPCVRLFQIIWKESEDFAQEVKNRLEVIDFGNTHAKDRQLK